MVLVVVLLRYNVGMSRAFFLTTGTTTLQLASRGGTGSLLLLATVW